MFLLIHLFITCAVLAVASIDEDGLTVQTKSNHSVALNFVYNQVYTFNITLSSPNIDKMLVQMITQGSIATVSLDKSFNKNSSSTGATTGVIATLPSNSTSFMIAYGRLSSGSNCSRNHSEVVSLSVVELNAKQPIPGACNLIHTLYYYPSLTAHKKKNFVEISFSPANVGFSSPKKEPVCDHSNSFRLRLLYDVYIVFFPYSYSNLSCEGCIKSSLCCQKAHSDEFSQKVSRLVNLNSVKFGSKVTTLSHSDKTKFAISTTPCSNMMVILNVRDPVRRTSAKYVPTVLFQTNDFVYDGIEVITKFVMIFLALIGILLCITGHRFFFVEVSIFTAIFCSIVSYVILKSTAPHLTFTSEFGIILGILLVAELVSCALWWRFRLVRCCCFLIGIVGGFLFSCSIFITPFININSFRNQACFFLSFTCAILLYLFILSTLSLRTLSIVTSSFVGSYLVVASVGCGVFFCSVISQIVMMALNRMIDPSFKQAIIALPFEPIDYGLVAVWGLLLVCGCCIQFWLMKGRPDFPECPYRRRQKKREYSETTNLLANADEVTCDGNSLSSRGASFTSENYEGDISGSIPDDAVDLLESFNNTCSQAST